MPVCAWGRSAPGATNLVTGLADAFLDRAPVVALTGQTSLGEMHKESHQYIDVVRMMKPVTKWNARIHDPEIIPEAVRKAFAVAEKEKPGATHLELPDDVMEAVTEADPVPRRPAPLVEPVAGELHRAAQLLQSAEAPVILAGNGVVRQNSAAALRRFCAQSGLNVITTFMGKGVIDSDSEHALFTAGLRAQDYPRGFMGKADLVVCVGYDLVEWSPRAWNPKRDRRVICIDTVGAEVDEHYVPDVELDRGHLVDPHPSRKPDLRQAPGTAAGPPYREMFRAALEAGSDDSFPIKPQRVLRDLRELMGAHDLLISDVGAHKLWISRHVAHPPAQHRPDLQRRGGDGLRRPGGRRRAHGAAGRPQGGHHLGRRRGADELPGDRDRQAARPGGGQPGVDRQRLRRDRDAPAAQIRPPGRYQIHEPRLGRAGRIVRDHGHPGRLGGGVGADAPTGARRRRLLRDRDSRGLPRELHLLPDADRPQPRLSAPSVALTPARSAARS